jgi:hypothetical protein
VRRAQTGEHAATSGGELTASLTATDRPSAARCYSNCCRRALLIVALLGALRSAAASPLRVLYEDGRLWVTANSAPAVEVCAAVAEITGIRFVIDQALERSLISVDIEGVDLERGVRTLLNDIPLAAGHSMIYSGANGRARLTDVTIFGARETPTGTVDPITRGASETPGLPRFRLLDLVDQNERMDEMLGAGVPPETAQRMTELTKEVQAIESAPSSAYRPGDLSPAAREQLNALLDAGVGTERAVELLLVQDKFRDAFRDVAALPAGFNTPGLPSMPVLPQAAASDWEPPQPPAVAESE